MLLPREQAVALGKHIPGFKSYPAMVLPIDSGKGMQGALVTYLSPDGRRNLRSKTGKNIRRVYGSKKGGYVQLGEIDPDQPPEPVVVAEGIETALSASQLTGFPAIAVLGADNYISITPPDCAELIIAADNDQVGKERAQSAAEWWAANGRTVRLRFRRSTRTGTLHCATAARTASTYGSYCCGARRSRPSELSPARCQCRRMQLELPPTEYLLEPWLHSGSINMLHAKRRNTQKLGS